MRKQASIKENEIIAIDAFEVFEASEAIKAIKAHWYNLHVDGRAQVVE